MGGFTVIIMQVLVQIGLNLTGLELSLAKFKFIDDLSILELINLLSIGLSSNNWKKHVASDVPESGYIVSSENLKSQSYLNQISEWTKKNKMELNIKKTCACAMIFNFTKDFQFTSQVKIEGKTIDIIQETKVIGVLISNELTWDKNTGYIVQKANSRMRLLHKLVEFGVPMQDLLNIYILSTVYQVYTRAIMSGMA